MLDVMFKDFMVLLQTITNNTNSKKCVRLYTAYQAGLFEQIDLKKGFEASYFNCCHGSANFHLGIGDNHCGRIQSSLTADC